MNGFGCNITTVSEDDISHQDDMRQLDPFFKHKIIWELTNEYFFIFQNQYNFV